MREEIFVRRIYRYKGVAVIVEIDFIKKTISFVEASNEHGSFKNKKWIFAQRGVEYMNGWRMILQAMDHAIVEATKELEELKEKDHKKLMNMLVDIYLPLDKKK
jgi:hypothetical protein